MNHPSSTLIKRWLAVLSLVVGIVLGARAESVEIDGLYYKLNTTDRTATLTYQSTGTDNYASIRAELVVPSSVLYNNITFAVTEISNRAFANCSSLESISIPPSVKIIGSNAAYNSSSSSDSKYYGRAGQTLPFYNCSALKSVRFEDGTEPIALSVDYSTYSSSYSKGAFYSCPLEEVYIGRNITYSSISGRTLENDAAYYGYSAFYNQSKLAKVTIGDNVTEILPHMFRNDGAIVALEIKGAINSVPKYSFYNCKLIPGVILPSSVTSVGEYAFYECSALENITLGNSQSIGDYAFYNTINLQSITLPSVLQRIGTYAFNFSAITEVIFPKSLTSIGDYAFGNCKNLTNVEFNDGILTLPYGCFLDCTKLTSINLGNSIETIENRAFANCSSLESISIPPSVKIIGSNAAYNSSSSSDSKYYGRAGQTLPFYNCSALKSVRFEDGTEPIALSVDYSTYSSSYSKGAFYSCPLEEVYIGRNITYSSISGRTLENDAAYYGYSAFYNQSKLAKVTIGESCTEIPDYLFYKNASLTLMALPNVKNIGVASFKKCSKLTTLNLGQNLQTVGTHAFYGCSNITKLTFPNSTSAIGDGAFYNCSSVTEVTVGSGIRSIGSDAFSGCRSFTALILPDEFTTMGEAAFEGCTKLTVAKLGESLEAVPEKAFKNCPALSEMNIPATAMSIGSQAFYNCSGLATISMKEGLKTIGNEVFWNNSGVTRFTIPGTVTSIGQNCFYGCTNVAYLIFSDGDEELVIDNRSCRSSILDEIILKNISSSYQSIYQDRGYDYFYDCPIRFLTIGRNLRYSYSDSKSIYDWNGSSWTSNSRATAPFVNKTDLRSVSIGPKVTYLYHHLLDGCSNVAKLTMSNGMKKIYSYALANCTSLTELSFPNPLVLFDDFACYNNYNLKSIVFNEAQGNNLEFKIGDYALAKCSLLNTLTFPAKTVSIGNHCFDGDMSLKDLTFVDSPKTLTIGNSYDNNKKIIRPIFADADLNKLYLGRNLTYVLASNDEAGYTYNPNYSPFHNQHFLTDITISQSGCVTMLHDYLFDSVNNCESLDLPESLTSIGRYAFSKMSVLDGVNIPSKIEWIKDGVFADCEKLRSIVFHPAVKKIDKVVFRNCSSLTNVTFEGNADLIEMGYGASRAEYGLFRDCPVETLNLDRWLSYNTEAASRAPFYSIPTLKNINIGENVGVIDKYMFSYCTGLEDLYLPDNIESVGLWGFRGCSSLKNVRFSEKLSQVSDYGFSECTSLDNVVFPASMTSIADNSFSNCTSLRKLDLGKKLNIIGPAAFKNDSALEGIEIPETLYGLGVEAFANCTSLPNVTIRAISSVGKQAFQGCTGLKWVSLSDKTTSLGENSFAGCTGINYIKSFAEFPPEGLVNLPAEVVANGTLFVPEYSVDYYQYSPTWEEWYSIRPLNDNIMVSSVSLDKSEISFKAAETAQLIAEVGAEDATDKAILWSTSNNEIATVDEAGLVTAVSVGEATVTALAADGSGFKAVCQVIVLPTLVESIAINSDINTLKKGRTLELNATVAPTTATNSTYTWSTSNAAIATVDAYGIVTAVSAGNVQIIATANDGSDVSTSFALTIIPPTKGDSNDNDVVTISDAVNTANYAVGNEVENFNAEAADVNEDNRVTLSDASATVAIVLDQPVQTSSMAKVRAIASATIDESDLLVIDDYSAKIGETTSVFVALDNTLDYVALQADVVVPEGMTLAAVNIGNRAEENHSLAVKRIDDRTMRIALFDINNSVFADNNDAILELIVKVNEAATGKIEINNILASDAQANEYVLTSTGGNNAEMSGIDYVGTSNIRIETTADGINIYNAEGCEIAIYAVDGTTLAHFVASSDFESRKVIPGVYVVAASNKVEKVMVK